MVDELTYMDCWHYIAPLIPVKEGTVAIEIYVKVFQALKEAHAREKEKKAHDKR